MRVVALRLPLPVLHQVYPVVRWLSLPLVTVAVEPVALRLHKAASAVRHLAVRSQTLQVIKAMLAMVQAARVVVVVQPLWDGIATVLEQAVNPDLVRRRRVERLELQAK